MQDLGIQSLANFIGTVLGGFLLLVFLEKKLKDNDNNKNVVRLFKSLYVELIYNYVVAERIISNSDFSLKTNKFPVAKFRTIGTFEFIAAFPIPDDTNKFYIKLNALTANMEMENFLIEQIFRSTDKSAIMINKKETIKNVDGVLKQLNEMLIVLAKYNDRYKFYQEENIDQMRKNAESLT